MKRAGGRGAQNVKGGQANACGLCIVYCGGERADSGRGISDGLDSTCDEESSRWSNRGPNGVMRV